MVIFTNCNDDDLPMENEEELITTLTYTLTPMSGGTPIIMSFRDIDGDGGDPPIISTQRLTSGVAYTGVLTLANESETPTEDITEEIEEEAEEHQFFFEIGGSIDMDITYADQDADGNPIGLTTELIAGDPGSGSLVITLRHEPDKSGMGVANGEIANAGGETDIEVSFFVTIDP